MATRTIFILFLVLGFSSKIIGQNKSVADVLNKAQQIITDKKVMRCNLHYTLYPTYTSKAVKENYGGKIIRNDDKYYLKINNTIFLNQLGKNDFLKLNVDEKLIQYITNVNSSSVNNTSLFDQLKLLLTNYKNQKITSTNSYWKCSFIADKISQMPYSKVEIYIDKSSNLVTKQIMYFSAQMPFTKKDGTTEISNPRLELTISDYDFSLTEDDKKITDLSHYINSKASVYTATDAYKNFKIIQD